MCHQETSPDLLSTSPWSQLGVLGPTHGASTWKTEWGLGSENKGGLTLPWPFLSLRAQKVLSLPEQKGA